MSTGTGTMMEVLKVEDAAELARVDPADIMKWVNDRRCPLPVVPVGKMSELGRADVRILRATLFDYLKARQRTRKAVPAGGAGEADRPRRGRRPKVEGGQGAGDELPRVMAKGRG